MSSESSMEEVDCIPLSASPEWQDVQPLEVDDGRKVCMGSKECVAGSCVLAGSCVSLLDSSAL